MNKHHAINYIEFPADDLATVKDFYSKAFGWKMTQLCKEVGDYLLATTSPMDENNMHKNKAAIKKVKAAGGKIQGKEVVIPGIGLFVMVKDTEGTAIGVLEPRVME